MNRKPYLAWVNPNPVPLTADQTAPLYVPEAVPLIDPGFDAPSGFDAVSPEEAFGAHSWPDDGYFGYVPKGITRECGEW